MNTATLRSSCLLTLLFLATTAAVPARSVAADTKAVPAAPASEPVPPVPPKPPLAGGGGIGGRGYTPEDLEQRIAEAAERAREAQARSSDAFARQEASLKLNGALADPNSFRFAGTSVRQSPALIVTHELTPEEKSEWAEDLTVMGKLLRDQIEDVSNDEEVLAMGIRVWLPTATTPTYIDGCGALFSLSIGVPLASSGKSTSAPTTRETVSAWERRNARSSDRSSAPKRFPRHSLISLSSTTSPRR